MRLLFREFPRSAEGFPIAASLCKMAKLSKVKEVRAYVQSAKVGRSVDQGADCHDVEDEHWINGFPVPIATPMSHHERYSRCGRKAWGINALGSVVVEVEAECGATGVGACSLAPHGRLALYLHAACSINMLFRSIADWPS